MNYLVLLGFVIGVPAVICAIGFLAVLADDHDREQERRTEAERLSRERHPAGPDL